MALSVVSKTVVTNIQTHPIHTQVTLSNLNLMDFALCFLPFFESAPGPFYMRFGEVDLLHMDSLAFFKLSHRACKLTM